MISNTHKTILSSLLFAGLFLSLPSSARAVTINFEGLVDFETVTTQYAGQGVTFVNATAAVAPPDGTLNEIDFPPTSGVTLLTNFDNVLNDFGAITITFGPYSMTSVSGYFTYGDYGLTGDALSVSAFSPTDAINPLLTLTLIENFGSTALLSFSGIGLIASLTAIGGSGSYFTLDDLTVQPFGTVVPEPSTWLLISVGLAGLGLRTRIAKLSRKSV